MKQENLGLKIWRVIYPAGIYFGISQIVSIVYAVILSFFTIFTNMQKGKTLTANQLTVELTEKLIGASMYMLIISAVIAIPILLIFYRKDKKRVFYMEERAAHCQVIDYVLVLVLAITGCIFFNNLIAISNIAKFSETYKKVSEAIYDSTIIVEILAAVILAPIVEEILFRGLIYKRLKEYINPMAGILISSLLFGIYHLNIVQGVYATLLGLVLAFLMEKYKNIKVPILAHMGANLFSVVLTEYKPLQKFLGMDTVFVASTIICFILGVIILLELKKRELTYSGQEKISL